MKQLVNYSSSDDDDENNNNQIVSKVTIKNRSHLSGTYPSFCKIDITQQMKNLNQCDEYHISLSYSFQLNYHQIDDFIDQVKFENNTQIFKCTLQQESKLFENESNGKKYSVLLVDINKQKIEELIQTLNQVICSYDNGYKNIKMIPHCTIKDYPFKMEKSITLQINSFVIEIGKRKTLIKLIQ